MNIPRPCDTYQQEPVTLPTAVLIDDPPSSAVSSYYQCHHNPHNSGHHSSHQEQRTSWAYYKTLTNKSPVIQGTAVSTLHTEVSCNHLPITLVGSLGALATSITYFLASMSPVLISITEKQLKENHSLNWWLALQSELSAARALEL